MRRIVILCFVFRAARTTKYTDNLTRKKNDSNRPEHSAPHTSGIQRTAQLDIFFSRISFPCYSKYRQRFFFLHRVNTVWASAATLTHIRKRAVVVWQAAFVVALGRYNLCVVLCFFFLSLLSFRWCLTTDNYNNKTKKNETATKLKVDYVK